MRCSNVVLLQVFFYSQSIFENAQVQPNYIPFAVMATNAVNVVMTLVAVCVHSLQLTVDRVRSVSK